LARYLLKNNGKSDLNPEEVAVLKLIKAQA
jgi:hypothetical protein